ncbi:MAG: SsrA-binding protein SmpB [Planctomycetales bacterium]|nr:SsrA-binding protein SmpB [Planctomycetales bacterium]
MVKKNKTTATSAGAAKAAKGGKSGKGGAKASASKEAAEKSTPVAENRKARHKFEVLDTLECGIVLVGSEAKSLRNGQVSLDESYARVRDGELWLLGCDIPEYMQANMWNHNPKRPRKLLLHGRELLKFAGRAHEDGLTLVPLKIYFNARGIAKVLVGLCRGKKLHDKRESLKKKDVERDIRRTMRHRNRR